MATIDLTNLARRNINKFIDVITWLEQNVGPHVFKGTNYSITIYESQSKKVNRAFGIGWHLDYETDADGMFPYKRIVTVYDELLAMMLKLSFEIEQ